MLASGVLNRVSEILQDTTSNTWTQAQLISWLNDALLSLALVRPDASTTSAAYLLTAGKTKQALSGSSDLRLISVDQNLGSDGLTAGRSIRLVDKKTKDAVTPDWHTDAPATVIKEYMFDKDRPTLFWVYPRPHLTTPVYVEMFKSVAPASIADVGDTLPVKDVYGPALIEWCCYRSFSRDSEQTPNWQRAARHFSAFFNLLQVKMQADMAINPKIRELAKTA